MCTDESAKSKRDVVVMKEDGEPIKFKQGTRVKDVLDEYPFHKIIRCCSDRTDLADSFHLNANWLYFLLPEGLAVNDTTYQSLIRAAFSRELIVSHVGAPPGRYTINGQAVECNKGIMSGDDKTGKKNMNWKPSLLTIVEITSPSVHSDK